MKKGTLFIGGFVAASAIAFVIYMLLKPVPPTPPPPPAPKFCDCDKTKPAPTCASCDTTCTLQHLECHEITEADFLERAYPAGLDTNVGLLYPATCQAITDIAEDTLCNSNIFVCTDISTPADNPHLSNKKIRISIMPRTKGTAVYYELQVIKALLTRSSRVPKPAAAFVFYNGTKCDGTGEDILFKALDATGATIYYGDLSSDYPTTP